MERLSISVNFQEDTKEKRKSGGVERAMAPEGHGQKLEPLGAQMVGPNPPPKGGIRPRVATHFKLV
jgi:hypothetical protein